jgi:hypothetical protein
MAQRLFSHMAQPAKLEIMSRANAFFGLFQLTSHESYIWRPEAAANGRPRHSQISGSFQTGRPKLAKAKQFWKKARARRLTMVDWRMCRESSMEGLAPVSANAPSCGSVDSCLVQHEGFGIQPRASVLRPSHTGLTLVT